MAKTVTFGSHSEISLSNSSQDMIGLLPRPVRIGAMSQRNRQRGVADWLNPKAPMLSRSLKETG